MPCFITLHAEIGQQAHAYCDSEINLYCEGLGPITKEDIKVS